MVPSSKGRTPGFQSGNAEFDSRWDHHITLSSKALVGGSVPPSATNSAAKAGKPGKTPMISPVPDTECFFVQDPAGVTIPFIPE